jgi:PAS domain S-box-containing protein
MSKTEVPRPYEPEEEAALRIILEGTATETGERFFAALVENLSRALGTHGAWVTEYLEDSKRLRALAFYLGGNWVQHYEHDIKGTPCEEVIEKGQLIRYPDNVLEFYPDEEDLKQAGAISYMGVPLKDVDGKVLGHLAVLDTRPLREQPRDITLFQIFAARAAAELRRMQAEARVREREEKLGRLVDSVMDAIVEFDKDLNVTLVNPAAMKVFCNNGSMGSGESFSRYLTSESRKKLCDLIGKLDHLPEGKRCLWIPGGLAAVSAEGQEFPAEATLSRCAMKRGTFYTIVLRDVNERLAAERRIHSLTVEAEYLKEEIRELHNSDEIIGRSEALLNVLHDVRQVAPTDTTVLILGETGTGKELFARAIHAGSPRSAKPLIRVNCAAIPVGLIESELFGHEKGAFTGATQKREGRFALADGGTIFLDEVGELALDMQAKLLRVLQEGEFEPVGSSRTHEVDVRVIAATNRDIARAVKNGEFREDLYYRLNVFPIEIPPLRRRGDDVVLLASSFATRFAQRVGRAFEPLTRDCIERLKAYDWPGNVRELENVIERAVITSHSGQLGLERALPVDAPVTPRPSGKSHDAHVDRVRTIKELQELERHNLILALEEAGWRVAGENGAARRLGISPSTLNSRIKALNIERPARAN